MKVRVPRFASVLAALTLPAWLPAQTHRHGPLHVVSSFTVLDDMVAQIAGEAVLRTVLVGPEQDAHTFKPHPHVNLAMHGADLVFFNGLHFEGWMKRLLQASEFKGRVVTMERGMPHLRHLGGYDDKNAVDPHAWHDVENGRHYVRTIRDALIQADPERSETYARAAAVYLDTLRRLHQELLRRFQAVPAARRCILTTHDAFGYFAAAYGLKCISLLGLSTDSQAGVADWLRVVRDARTSGASGVFLERSLDPRVARQLALETGLRLGGELYADGLGRAGGPAGTYLSMLRHNAQTLLAILY